MKEKLAKLAHEQWSGWMKYLFSKCVTKEGELVIPQWAVERWSKQARTHYEALSKEEKDSDRTEADKFIAVFKEHIEQLQAEIERLKDIMFSFGTIYEDDLPELTNEQFAIACYCSKVDGVRLYPKIIIQALTNMKGK